MPVGVQCSLMRAAVPTSSFAVHLGSMPENLCSMVWFRVYFEVPSLQGRGRSLPPLSLAPPPPHS